MPTKTAQTRVRADHTADSKARIRRLIAEGSDLYVSVEADAVKLDDPYRHHVWDTHRGTGESFPQLVSAFLAPRDGDTFGARVNSPDSYACGDEQLVRYVLAVDPEHLDVVLDVRHPEDVDPNAGVSWTVTARAGDTLADLVALVVAAALAEGL